MSVALQPAARGTETLEFSPEATLAARHRMALRDLREACGLWRLCWTLAWLDIKLRYRGSVLGPFWLTISTAVMVAAMGWIYAALFRMNLRDYLPFLTLSLVLWNFFSSLVGDACQGFTASESMIRSVRMPFSLYAARIVVRNVLVLAHNLLVIVAVIAIYDLWPGVVGLMALPAFGVWLIDSFALVLLLGAVCARFRDIPPIVGSVMQMLFFVTPVIWQPAQAGAARQWLLPFNPCFSALEILRGPVLGAFPAGVVWLSALGYSALLWLIAWLLFVRIRGRIAFWV